MDKDQELAGASYILTFFKEIQQLTHSYAQYLNVMLELEQKYGNVDFKEVTEVERQTLGQTFQTVRYYSLKCYIQYHAIKPTLKLKDSHDIEDSYKSIKQTFIIDRQILEKYVIGLNTLLVENIIKNLLETSQDIVKQVYNNGSPAAE